MKLPIDRLTDTVSARIIASADELTALDSAIGDADHGLNMKRGFEAVLADRQRIAALPLPEALKAIGTVLVMKVGGASGPLYGTLFLALAKELPAEPTLADAARALAVAVAAVKARGKSDVGAKTLLEVLAPLAALLASGDASFVKVKSSVDGWAEATIPMLATRGRASFLGPRSVGHMDPGARSSAIMVRAICDVLEGAA